MDSHPGVQELVMVTELDADEIEKRLESRNTCYIARLRGTPVAYGWVAAAGGYAPIRTRSHVGIAAEGR